MSEGDCSGLLGLGSRSIDDPYFYLGGTMIVAARVAVGCMKNLFYPYSSESSLWIGKRTDDREGADPRASHRADHSNTDSAYP